MSEETKQPVNYSDFMYSGDETITMTAQEFGVLKAALHKALQNGVKGDYPQVLRFFNLKSGKPVEKPTTKQIESGAVKQFADNEATFSQENMVITYDNNVYPEIFNANQTYMMIHQRMVDTGVAKTTAQVKKLYEERQAAGQMKVQEKVEKVATMNVVSDKESEE